ncbi:hypothetical Protein YC6258_05938 [Gynuella sunshinyii YC6258]|uniref:Uncharacterized protein n=1 Tax=Gynuella sunshinyii YC6258 TaxID=1445510 RepID=A0A0C5VTE9_9GAMM|nr:hypothetical Protein YC6258_05938 [Gynuella sunshinyii YC6258]
MDHVFSVLQEADVINIQTDQVSLDNTIIKVHPDGTGALKKWPTSHWEIKRWMDN